jgi:hypothetical protein
MKSCWTLLILIFALARAEAAVERVVEKTFPVEIGAALKIDTAQGPIRVGSSDRNEIRVVVRQVFDVATESEADARAQQLELRFNVLGGTVNIVAQYRRSMRWAWESWPPVALTYEVIVPRDCNLELRSRDGDITVGSLRGSVRVHTERGMIFIGETEGGITASSGRGDVAVTACTGDLVLSAQAGNVLVGRAGGVVNVQGSGGTIEVQNARGRVEAVGDNADLKIGFAGSLTTGSELRASGGDVVVTFDPKSAFDVVARASAFGEVRVRDLPLAISSGAAGSSRLEGRLNGGGPVVRISASGGNVRLGGAVAVP